MGHLDAPKPVDTQLQNPVESLTDAGRLGQAVELIKAEATLLQSKYRALYVGREVHIQGEESDVVKKSADYPWLLNELIGDIKSLRERVRNIVGAELDERIKKHPDPDSVEEWKQYFDACWEIPNSKNVEREIGMIGR